MPVHCRKVGRSIGKKSASRTVDRPTFRAKLTPKVTNVIRRLTSPAPAQVIRQTIKFPARVIQIAWLMTGGVHYGA